MKDYFDYKTFGDRLTTIEDDLSLNRPYSSESPLPVKNCWHFSTPGQYVDSMYYSDRDFSAGMNRAATCALRYRVIILAICLMDNHVHFVLYGLKEECEAFIYEYVRLTSFDIAVYQKKKKKLSLIPVTILPIRDLDYLQTVICYVLQNPSSARTGFSYYDYPWSNGALLFRKTGYWTETNFDKIIDNDDSQRVKKIADMNINESRKVMASRKVIPAQWKIIDEIIFPGYYIPVRIVERIFRTQHGFKHVFTKLKEQEVDKAIGHNEKIKLNDKEMREHRDKIAHKLFGHSNIRSLNVEQRVRLARELYGQFHSSTRQISAMVCLPYAEIQKLFYR